MNGSCNEYGFKNQGFLRRRLEKGRIQGLNASIAPVIGWVGLKVAGIKVKSKPKLFFKQ